MIHSRCKGCKKKSCPLPATICPPERSRRNTKRSKVRVNRKKKVCSHVSDRGKEMTFRVTLKPEEIFFVGFYREKNGKVYVIGYSEKASVVKRLFIKKFYILCEVWKLMLRDLLKVREKSERAKKSRNQASKNGGE